MKSFFYASAKDLDDQLIEAVNGYNEANQSFEKINKFLNLK